MIQHCWSCLPKRRSPAVTVCPRPSTPQRIRMLFARFAKDFHPFPIKCLFLVVAFLQVQPLFAGEFNFLTEHPGKFSAPVSSHIKLSKTESAVFKRNLEQLRNLLAKQPVFNPPRGVEIIGYFRPNDEQPKTKKVPIPGFGYLRFHFYHLDHKSGKPVRICCTTDEIYVTVNDPGKGFDAYSAVLFPTRAFYEPKQVGEMAGFPVYRMDNGNEVIVLNRSTTPAWIPVSREEYVTGWLANWEKEAAKSPPQDTITPDIVRRHRAALASMSAVERKMQARTYSWDPFEPTLAPVGSDEGRPLVRGNPAWFDPKLPRSAFQLITLQFNYTGNLNHENPGATEHGDIAPYRVWQTLHTSDWKEISGALTDK